MIVAEIDVIRPARRWLRLDLIFGIGVIRPSLPGVSTTMRVFVHVLIAALATTCLAAAAEAKVRITVDLDSQTMHVEAKDKVFDWKVSSGKSGYETPPGKYKVLWMDKDHHSDEYDQAPMPNAIFFSPGFAIHGFGKSPWGHPASHGCVRLPVAKSAVLFSLVKAEGGAEIEVVGDTPAPTVTAGGSRRNRVADDYDSGPRVFYNGVDGDRGRSYAAPPAPGYTTYDPLYGQVY